MLRAFNLGNIRVVGVDKTEPPTTDSIILSDVLELKIESEKGKIIVQPIDYPLNTEIFDTMEILSYNYEYSEDSIKKIEAQYTKVMCLIMNDGIDITSLHKTNIH